MAYRLEVAVQERRRKKLRLRQARARFVRGVVISVIFLILMGVALLFGTHVIINPMSPASSDKDGVAQSEKHRTGWIVQDLFDGSNCRYSRFDNATGRIGGDTTAECDDFNSQGKPKGFSTFTWGAK